MDVRSQESLPTPRCCYDVFLSFRSKDIGKTFIDHLYTALVQVGLHTFRYDDKITKGENIESELLKAIEQSRFSIIVFSKRYAGSTRCLNELLKILHCKNTSHQQVLPIFYDVYPSEVGKQTGSFAEAFTRHEMQCQVETDERKKESINKVESWRTALREVADLARMVLQNEYDGYEAKFIQKIVQVIKDKLDRRVWRNTPFLIGLEHRLRYIKSWLRDEMMDASVFIIRGTGGIGKTTIAKEIYNLYKRNFDASSFLENISQRSKLLNGLIEVQKQLLSEIGKEQTIRCVEEGIMKIKDVVCSKRVLLVLDDVDDVEQLDAVFGMRQWFSTGSKVIVTTRLRCLFNAREVHRVHEVAHLDIEESLKLFSWHAFGQHFPSEDYKQISERVVQSCGGLPLALKVLGTTLAGQSLSIWKSALDKLEAFSDNEICKKLEISYSTLPDEHDKKLFLHVACFFVGWDKDWTTKILDECGFFTIVGIENLVDRCLLTIDMCNKLTMHPLIREMGRQIDRQKSKNQLGKYRRLWRDKDSLHVLREKMGTDTIEVLILDMQKLKVDDLGTTGFTANNARKRACEEIRNKSLFEDLGTSTKQRFLTQFSCPPVDTSLRNSSNIMSLNTDAFVKMNNLKLLQLNYLEITGCLKKFPKTLRCLCLDGFPSEFIPSDFPMENLVALQMHHSSLKQIWKECKILNRLKILDLSHSHELSKTPDFSGLTELEILILEDCVSLVEVHLSIVKLERLIVLNLKDCKNLKKLPRNIGMLKSIETLIISGCSDLDWLPNKLGTMNSLKVLRADGVAINQLFSTTEEVQPWGAIMWSGLLKPQKSKQVIAISLPHSLVTLSLAGCNLPDEAFPLDFGKLLLLEDLDLSRNRICGLPESIRSLTRLKQLKLNSCRRLKSISLRSNLNLSSYDCCSIVEIDGYLKLEPLTDVDVQILRRWGFLNINLAGHVMINYFYTLNLRFATTERKLPLQRLFQQGVYNYFFTRNTVPEVFSIRSTGSHLSFVVPSLIHYNLRGLVVCCLYTTSGTVRYGWDRLYIKLKKRFNVMHYGPLYFGVPNDNENMAWVSHWKFGDSFQGDEEIELSVHTTSSPDISPIDVKELGIQLVYEQQEENGTPSVLEVASSQSFVTDYPSRVLVNGILPMSWLFDP